MNLIPRDATASVMLTGLMDAANLAARDAEKPRDYLGGSRLGEECERRLGFEYAHAPSEREPNGALARMAARGHVMEDAMAEWLRAAGFQLVTKAAHGGQIGWGVARDPETGRNRISGHLDGLITGFVAQPGYGDAAVWALGLPYPLLWECKTNKDSVWRQYGKVGLCAAKPVYYAQCQVYMAHMDVAHTLFTALNPDSMAIYAEVVPFDMAAAQAASDRGVRVISARAPEELPRIARDPTDFRCKFCDYPARCWAPAARGAEPAAVVQAPQGWGAWS